MSVFTPSPKKRNAKECSNYWTIALISHDSKEMFKILHQSPEYTQTQVHRVSDAIQPSHPLSSPSPPALNLSHHQGLLK